MCVLREQQAFNATLRLVFLCSVCTVVFSHSAVYTKRLWKKLYTGDCVEC